MNEPATKLAPPRRRMLLWETRAAVDLVRMAAPLLQSAVQAAPCRDGSPVIVVPGYGADDRFTVPLRRYLAGLGFRTEGWGMGRNNAGLDMPHSISDLSEHWQVSDKHDYRGEVAVPYLCDRFAERVGARYRELGEPVTLIGWSLGGYIARETARDLPAEITHVVTLGSPVVGGPKYTATGQRFSRRGLDLDWIEEQISKREVRPIRQRVTAIYSKSDAVVAWQAAVDRYSKNVRHVEVNAAHLGMVFNPTIWRHIVSAISSV